MIIYRKMLPTEGATLRSLLLELDANDRRARFMGITSDDEIIAYCRRLDWARVLMIGAFVDGALVGCVEVHSDRVFWPGQAELALAVSRRRQGVGIGRELTRRALLAARNRGIETVHLWCARSNERMRRAGVTFGGTLSLDGGECLINFTLPRLNQFSLAKEAWEDGSGMVASVWAGLGGGGVDGQGKSATMGVAA